MPLVIERDDIHRRLLVEFVDPVDIDAWIKARQEQAAQGRWHYATLIDASHSSPPTTADLERIRDVVAVLSRSHRPLGPVAMLAPTDALYGMGRMFEALTEDQPREFAVFRTREEAERWLDERQRDS